MRFNPPGHPLDTVRPPYPTYPTYLPTQNLPKPLPNLYPQGGPPGALAPPLLGGDAAAGRRRCEPRPSVRRARGARRRGGGVRRVLGQKARWAFSGFSFHCLTGGVAWRRGHRSPEALTPPCAPRILPIAAWSSPPKRCPSSSGARPPPRTSQAARATVHLLSFYFFAALSLPYPPRARSPAGAHHLTHIVHNSSKINAGNRNVESAVKDFLQKDHACAADLDVRCATPRTPHGHPHRVSVPEGKSPEADAQAGARRAGRWRRATGATRWPTRPSRRCRRAGAHRTPPLCSTVRSPCSHVRTFDPTGGADPPRVPPLGARPGRMALWLRGVRLGLRPLVSGCAPPDPNGHTPPLSQPTALQTA